MLEAAACADRDQFPDPRLARLPAGSPSYCGWTKSISHHFQPWQILFLLLLARESSFQRFLGGAGLRPSTRSSNRFLSYFRSSEQLDKSASCFFCLRKPRSTSTMAKGTEKKQPAGAKFHYRWPCAPSSHSSLQAY